MNLERKNVGESAVELLKSPDPKQGVVDTQKEMNKHCLPQIEECINNHAHWTEPFYIVVINKRERLLVNVIRQYFVARQTLPTPDFDQSVFKYFPSTGDLNYLWTVPDQNTIIHMIANETSLPTEQQELLKFCKLFQQNKLDVVCGK